MTTRRIRNELEKADAIDWLADTAPPFSITIDTSRHRTIEQNKLQRLWMKEASEQLADHSPEENRAYCKLHYGVPILRNDDENFMAAYDKIIGPQSYEDKLAMMAVPLDFPVTRLMTTKQKKQYLDDVYQHFTGLGVNLTEPKDDPA